MHGVPARGPPPERRLLGRLLAREHVVPARRRPDAGLSRRCRDERVHPTLSDGQRAYDLDILVENVGFGLADLGVMQERADDFEDAVDAADSVRRPVSSAVGRASPRTHLPARRPAGDPGPYPAAQRAWFRDRRDRARARRPEARSPSQVAVTYAPVPRPGTRARLTGLRALEGQAQLLLNDLREYRAWLRGIEGGPSRSEAPDRWLRDVFEPTLATPEGVDRPQRDPFRRTATCSSTSGCSPRPPDATSAWRRRSDPT